MLFKRILAWLCHKSAAFAGIILLGIALLITLDVFKRWMTGKPFVGVFEISQVGFLAVTFLALAYVEHQRSQMRVDLLCSQLKGIFALILEAFTALLSLIFWGTIFWQATNEWIRAYTIHDVRLGMIEIPKTVELGFMIFGSFMGSIVLIAILVMATRNFFFGKRPVKKQNGFLGQDS